METEFSEKPDNFENNSKIIVKPDSDSNLNESNSEKLSLDRWEKTSIKKYYISPDKVNSVGNIGNPTNQIIRRWASRSEVTEIEAKLLFTPQKGFIKNLRPKLEKMRIYIEKCKALNKQIKEAQDEAKKYKDILINPENLNIELNSKNKSKKTKSIYSRAVKKKSNKIPTFTKNAINNISFQSMDLNYKTERVIKNELQTANTCKKSHRTEVSIGNIKDYDEGESQVEILSINESVKSQKNLLEDFKKVCIEKSNEEIYETKWSEHKTIYKNKANKSVSNLDKKKCKSLIFDEINKNRINDVQQTEKISNFSKKKTLPFKNLDNLIKNSSQNLYLRKTQNYIDNNIGKYETNHEVLKFLETFKKSLYSEKDQFFQAISSFDLDSLISIILHEKNIQQDFVNIIDSLFGTIENSKNLKKTYKNCKQDNDYFLNIDDRKNIQNCISKNFRKGWERKNTKEGNSLLKMSVEDNFLVKFCYGMNENFWDTKFDKKNSFFEKNQNKMNLGNLECKNCKYHKKNTSNTSSSIKIDDNTNHLDDSNIEPTLDNNSLKNISKNKRKHNTEFIKDSRNSFFAHKRKKSSIAVDTKRINSSIIENNLNDTVDSNRIQHRKVFEVIKNDQINKILQSKITNENRVKSSQRDKNYSIQKKVQIKEKLLGTSERNDIYSNMFNSKQISADSCKLSIRGGSQEIISDKRYDGITYLNHLFNKDNKIIDMRNKGPNTQFFKGSNRIPISSDSNNIETSLQQFGNSVKQKRNIRSNLVSPIRKELPPLPNNMNLHKVNLENVLDSALLMSDTNIFEKLRSSIDPILLKKGLIDIEKPIEKNSRNEKLGLEPILQTKSEKRQKKLKSSDTKRIDSSKKNRDLNEQTEMVKFKSKVFNKGSFNLIHSFDSKPKNKEKKTETPIQIKQFLDQILPGTHSTSKK